MRLSKDLGMLVLSGVLLALAMLCGCVFDETGDVYAGICTVFTALAAVVCFCLWLPEW